jgi:hypothetical protein
MTDSGDDALSGESWTGQRTQAYGEACPRARRGCRPCNRTAGLFRRGQRRASRCVTFSLAPLEEFWAVLRPPGESASSASSRWTWAAHLLIFLMAESVVAGVPVAIPMLDIRTVGVAGGSIARFDHGGALRVGLESADSEPGPTCFGRGTLATVTDAHLILGRLALEGLLGGGRPLDATRTFDVFRSVPTGQMPCSLRSDSRKPFAKLPEPRWRSPFA